VNPIVTDVVCSLALIEKEEEGRKEKRKVWIIW
jgi:hypothetical protein